MRIAAHAVLRPEQGHQLDIRRFVQNIDRRPQSVVDSGRIRNQPDALALEQFEPLRFQHLYSRLDDDRASDARSGQQQRQADQQTLFHPLSFSFLLP